MIEATETLTQNSWPEAFAWAVLAICITAIIITWLVTRDG